MEINEKWSREMLSVRFDYQFGFILYNDDC